MLIVRYDEGIITEHGAVTPAKSLRYIIRDINLYLKGHIWLLFKRHRSFCKVIYIGLCGMEHFIIPQGIRFQFFDLSGVFCRLYFFEMLFSSYLAHAMGCCPFPCIIARLLRKLGLKPWSERAVQPSVCAGRR